MAKNDKKQALLTAKEFDGKFESGEDISQHMDWDNALHRFPASAPKWALQLLTEEAERRGSTREAYVREMIVQRADELRAGQASESRGEGLPAQKRLDRIRSR